MKKIKKILFIDEENFQTDMRAQLLINSGDHEVDVVNSFAEVKSLFSKDKYDIVIIDFSRDFGEESLRYIDSIDAMQDMITISKDETYSEQLGCDYCLAHHKRRRLVPPFPFPDLLKYVEHFDVTTCAMKHKFEP